jgi:hypothetical protein
MLAEVEEDYGDLFDAGGARLSDYKTERLLLGYLIHRPQLIAEAVEMVRSNDFFNPFHRRIYETLERTYEAGEGIGAGTLVQALGGDPKAILFDDVTTGAYIAGLVADADMSIDISEHAQQIAECSERRAVGSADDVDLGTLPVHSRFGGQRWEDIGRSVAGNAYSWAIEDVIPMGEITLAYGDSGTGKSFNMFDMAMCVSRNMLFNGKNVEHGLVVYVAAEAGKGFGKRKIAYSMHHGLSPDDPLPFYLMTKRPDFFGSETDVENLIAEIRALAKTYRQKLVLITLDTLSALAPGMNENASADVSRVRARLVRISEAFPEAAIVLVHHKPKGGSTPRGHGSLTADFETTIEFETTELKSKDGLKVHKATVRKQREGKSGVSWQFVLPVVDVGRNKWGNPETSCVVLPYDGSSHVAVYGFRANKTELAFLEALFDVLNERGVAPPSGLPASITRAAALADVRAKMRERYIQSKADNRFRQAFKRAGDALKAGKVIGYRDPLVWYSGKPVHGLTATLTPVQIDE